MDSLRFGGDREAGGSPSHTSGEVLRDAVRYWEYRRVPYNLALIALVIVLVVRTWPHFRPALTFESVPYLLVFAVLANICYSVAYLADLPLQLSAFQGPYRRWRWTVWVAGTFLAVLVAAYWILDEIYPAVS